MTACSTLTKMTSMKLNSRSTAVSSVVQAAPPRSLSLVTTKLSLQPPRRGLEAIIGIKSLSIMSTHRSTTTKLRAMVVGYAIQTPTTRKKRAREVVSSASTDRHMASVAALEGTVEVQQVVSGTWPWATQG